MKRCSMCGQPEPEWKRPELPSVTVVFKHADTAKRDLMVTLYEGETLTVRMPVYFKFGDGEQVIEGVIGTLEIKKINVEKE